MRKVWGLPNDLGPDYGFTRLVSVINSWKFAVKVRATYESNKDSCLVGFVGLMTYFTLFSIFREASFWEDILQGQEHRARMKNEQKRANTMQENSPSEL